MTLAVWLLVVAAEPTVAVGPVAPPGGVDPIRRRLGALHAGLPVRAGTLAVAPLYGEEEKGAGTVELALACARGRPVDAGAYLRLRNESETPRLLLAGTAFRTRAAELFLRGDLFVPAAFAALGRCARAEAGIEGDAEATTLLPPWAVNALVRGDDEAFRSVRARWVSRLAPWYDEAAERAAVVRAWRRLDAASARLARNGRLPLVGAVFLVGEVPVSAHAFASGRLFETALPALLDSVAVQEQLLAPEVARTRRPPSAADLRDAAVAFLRRFTNPAAGDEPPPGDLFEATLVHRETLAAAHAVFAPGPAVVHVGVTCAAPEARPVEPPPAASADPLPPPAAEQLPSGISGRRPRTSLAEEWKRAQRDRELEEGEE